MARTPPLVDRDREELCLRAAVDALARGVSTVVEVTGDPGMGKTRLLSEIVGTARDKGLVVLSGRASEFEQDRPFAVFEAWLRLHDTRPPEVERFRFFGTVVQQLETVAQEAGGVLLCLDDLHWADDGSLELLHYLLRNAPASPVAVVCGYRPRQAGPRLLTSLSQTSDAYRVERLELLPLRREAADLLLGTDMPEEQRDRLYTASGGNPLYLDMLARLAESPQTAGPAVFADLPRSLRAALVRETALLTPEQLTVLRAAAVLGDPFAPDLLPAVADLSPGPAWEALDTLTAMDLLRCGGSPDPSPEMEFRHPLLRELVSAESPPGWRMAAHGRADQALRETGADPLQRAPHVARSAAPGDPGAVRLLCEAATHTIHSAPATAASWLRAALRLLRSSGRTGELRFEVLLSLARALGLTGDLAGFREALGEALELLPPDRRDRRVPVVALQAQVERILGDIAEARAVLEAELAAWPESSGAANPLRLELATVLMIQRSYDRSAAHLDTALHHASGADDRGVRFGAAACRALGAAYNGASDALAAHATAAANAVDAMRDEELTGFLDPLSQLGWAEVLAERYNDTTRHVTRGIRIARRTGQSHVLPHLLLAHSWSHRSVGQLAEALSSAAAAEEMAYLLDQPDLLGYALALRAEATLLRDDPAAAAPLAETALRTVRARGRLRGLTAGALATVRFEQGRLADCLALVQDLVDQPRHSGPAHSVKAGWYSIAAQAEVSADRPDAARAWAERAAEAAAAVGLRGQHGHASVARAHAVAHQDAAAAAELLTAAAADFAATGQVLVESRTRLALARVLADTGRPADAVEQAGLAKRTAQTYGANHLYAQAVNAQRRLGALGPRTRARALPSLSPREREIAELAGRGLSNREIAEAAYLSVKTVEAHLTRAFRKLGISSRSALIQSFARPEAHQFHAR